jgi:hypothetical protein
MKAFATVFSAVVVGLTLAGTVPAAPIPDEARPAREGLVTPDELHTSDGDSESPRVVTGRVLRVNADEGTIVIQTPVGVIALRGPREDLKDVNVGDIVQVEMVDGNYPSASPRLEPSDDD